MGEILEARPAQPPSLAAIIEQAEAAMLTMPQAEFRVTHHFGPGVYVREMFMPAGSLVVGHHHKEAHLNIMLKGRLTLVTSDGDHVEMVAPHMYVAGPGRKTAITHEDVVWLNVHPNISDEQNVEKLDEVWLVKSQAWHDVQAPKLEEK